MHNVSPGLIFEVDISPDRIRYVRVTRGIHRERHPERTPTPTPTRTRVHPERSPVHPERTSVHPERTPAHPERKKTGLGLPVDRRSACRQPRIYGICRQNTTNSHTTHMPNKHSTTFCGCYVLTLYTSTNGFQGQRRTSNISYTGHEFL